MSPSSASFRKQSRHSANFRMYARGRPHRRHRLRNRTLNFGVFFSLTIFAVVAINLQFALNGMPINWSSFLASSSVRAVVTTDTFRPRGLSTFM